MEIKMRNQKIKDEIYGKEKIICFYLFLSFFTESDSTQPLISPTITESTIIDHFKNFTAVCD